MIENQNAEQIEEERVDIEVTEDPVENSAPVDDGDERVHQICFEAN